MAIAYLLGSIDFGVIVPRMFGVDIYATGSGNPGTSNVFRSLGKGPAALVLFGDGAKGALAAAIGTLWAGTVSNTVSVETLAVACAFFAVVGHVVPVWHRFHGGRGVATAIGGAIFLAPNDLTEASADRLRSHGIDVLDLNEVRNVYSAPTTATLGFSISSECATSTAFLRISIFSSSVGAMFGYFLTDDAITDWDSAAGLDRSLFARFYQVMLESGVYLAPSPFESGFVSTVHGDAEREILGAAADAAFQAVASE